MDRARIVVYVDPDLADLIPGYLNNRRKDVITVRDAIAQHDMESVWRIGHNMKGNGTSYGFDAITAFGAELEKGGKEQDLESVNLTLTCLEVYLDRVEIVYGQGEDVSRY